MAYNYGDNTAVFCERFKLLIDGIGGQTSFSKATGISTQTIGFWYNGQRMPSAEGLRKIAVFFNVSADYLLGLSDAPTNDIEMKSICEYTGLSLKALDNIKSMNTLSDTVNKVFESKMFWACLAGIEAASDGVKRYCKIADQTKAEILGAIECGNIENALDIAVSAGSPPSFESGKQISPCVAEYLNAKTWVYEAADSFKEVVMEISSYASVKPKYDELFQMAGNTFDLLMKEKEGEKSNE